MYQSIGEKLEPGKSAQTSTLRLHLGSRQIQPNLGQFPDTLGPKTKRPNLEHLANKLVQNPILDRRVHQGATTWNPTDSPNLGHFVTSWHPTISPNLGHLEDKLVENPILDTGAH